MSAAEEGIYERNGVREYGLVDAVAGEVTLTVLILAGLEEDVSTLVAGGEEGVPSDA